MRTLHINYGARNTTRKGHFKKRPRRVFFLQLIHIVGGWLPICFLPQSLFVLVLVLQDRVRSFLRRYESIKILTHYYILFVRKRVSSCIFENMLLNKFYWRYDFLVPPLKHEFSLTALSVDSLPCPWAEVIIILQQWATLTLHLKIFFGSFLGHFIWKLALKVENVHEWLIKLNPASLLTVILLTVLLSYGLMQRREYI